MDSNNQPGANKAAIMKKTLKIVGVIIILYVVSQVSLYGYTYWKIKTGRLVKWDGKWYTKEQLEKKYGPQYYEVPAKNTPEEVYVNFREALLRNDVEGALSYIREENREKYGKNFYDKEMIIKYKKLPNFENIIKSEKDSSENFSSFYYKDNDNKIYNINFEKNADGYWQIDFI